MNDVGGGTVRDMLASGRATNDCTVIGIALNVARVLLYMHGQGVAFGDLSPGNVLIRADGSVCIADLEHAYRYDRPWRGFHGTAGFYPVTGVTSPSDSFALRTQRDVYALAALIHAMFSPDWFLQQVNSGVVAKAWDRPPLPDRVPRAIAHAIDSVLGVGHDHQDLPTIADFIDLLQGAP